jgi:hypothetical protein
MIDLKKTYRTRAGWETRRLYATDGCGPYPIHGAVRHPGSGWMSHTWTNDGYSNASKRETESDLIEVQPERWHPIIKFSSAFCLVESTYPTREEAMVYPLAVDAWKEPGEQA